MNRSISKKETRELFLFCQKHFVYHYDLQIELVDHLASGIEEQWQTNPRLSFDSALKNTYRKFGIYGFGKIKEQKQKELHRKYRHILWSYFLEFYRWPKFLFTLTLSLGLFTLLRMVPSVLWVLIPYLILVSIGAFTMFYVTKKKQPKVKYGKKFMLLDYLKQRQSVAIILSQLPINAYNITRSFDFNALNQTWILFAIAFTITSLNVALWGYFFYIPQKVTSHFTEQFPEFVA